MKIFRNPRDDWLTRLHPELDNKSYHKKTGSLHTEMNQFYYMKFGQDSHRINLLYDLHEF